MTVAELIKELEEIKEKDLECFGVEGIICDVIVRENPFKKGEFYVLLD